jgi:hypothetical protein
MAKKQCRLLHGRSLSLATSLQQANHGQHKLLAHFIHHAKHMNVGYLCYRSNEAILLLVWVSECDWFVLSLQSCIYHIIVGPDERYQQIMQHDLTSPYVERVCTASFGMVTTISSCRCPSLLLLLEQLPLWRARAQLEKQVQAPRQLQRPLHPALSLFW